MNVSSAFRVHYNQREHLLMIQASFWFKENIMQYIGREQRFNGNARDLLWSQFIELYSTHFPKEAAELNDMYDNAVIDYEENKFLWSLCEEFTKVEFNPTCNGSK